MKNSADEKFSGLYYELWWMIPVFLFFCFWYVLCPSLYTDNQLLKIKRQYFYLTVAIVQICILLASFWTYKIDVKKLFKPKKINILLILKLVLIAYVLGRILRIHYIIPNISYTINYFKETRVNSNIFQNSYLWNFVFIGGVFVAPVCEEVFFRFYYYNSLKAKYNDKLTANIISSLIFALFHISMYGLDFILIITISIFAMLLAYAYEKTKTIWTPILMHSLHNASVSFFSYLTTPYRTLLSLIYIAVAIILITIEIIKYLKRRKINDSIKAI